MVLTMRNQWSVVSIFPMLLILSVIGIILYAYTHFHIIRGLSQDFTGRDEEYKQIVVEACVVGYLSFMLFLNYALAVFTDPGQVPDDYVWALQDCETSPACAGQPRPNETKRTGERRHCKWCGKYKPDRTHHCRICQCCVLKMDHHCPWIANCVGWRNHKYFFLLVIHSLLDCYFVAITMWPTLQNALNKWEMPFMSRFALVCAETLAVVSCGPLTLFLGFHGFLMFSGLTTIEFCEKSVRGFDSKSIYDGGIFSNLTQVLGWNPLLWPFPLGRSVGEGLSFRSRTHPEAILKTAADKCPETDLICEQREPEWTGEPANSN